LISYEPQAATAEQHLLLARQEGLAMFGSIGARVQTAIVILLFLGSLATVVISAMQTLSLPQAEEQVQNRLREASQRLSEKSEPEINDWDDARPGNFEAVNARLRQVSEQVLRDFPGVEGGFYLNDGNGRFAGFGYPTSDHEGPRRGQVEHGDDPPPREAPFILVQAQHSLTLPSGEFQFDVRTVGPSRVAILTRPVGPKRPAPAATWTMFRVTKPEDLTVQVFRYQVSTILALGGIALALVLTVNLVRTLRRQRLEQERLREELRRNEHLAALGKLLAGVAHEVRNPLAGIRSTVQLWERLPETFQNPGSMEAVIHAVDRLNDIVTRLLYFSRSDSSNRQPVQIGPLLAETLDLIKAQATSQHVLIECAFAPDVPAVSGSANGLRQVFLNLATNALQVMPTGGRLRCTTRFETATKMVEIRIEDTGPGISSDNQKHLFEPFFTTRPDGTGLGLALCREIVLQHGGQIELASSTSNGVAFQVLLPVG
jgi:two-component system, NtrC family, sensor histidine kinase HydH